MLKFTIQEHLYNLGLFISFPGTEIKDLLQCYVLNAVLFSTQQSNYVNGCDTCYIKSLLSGIQHRFLQLVHFLLSGYKNRNSYRFKSLIKIHAIITIFLRVNGDL